MTSLKTKMQQIIYGIFDPFVALVRKVGITPNGVTTIGFLINIIGSGYLVWPMRNGDIPEPHRLVGFGVIILFAGLMDMLDGRMARLYDLRSTYGAFYDSVMDRYSELVMFMGLMAFFIGIGDWLLIFLSFWAMCGSLMVSYARARAEGLGVDCSVGLLQRPERIVMVTMTCIVAGLLLGHFRLVLVIGLGVVSLLANYTAFQRMFHVKKQTENNPV